MLGRNPGAPSSSARTTPVPENETPNGYVIGFRELYESIQSLDRKLDTQHSETAKTLVQHGARLDALEHNNAKRWQMVSLWITCCASLLAGSIGVISQLFHH